MLLAVILFVFVLSVVFYHVAYQRYLAFGITKPAPKLLVKLSTLVWKVRKAYIARTLKQVYLYVNTEEPDLRSIELNLLKRKQHATDAYGLGLYEVILILPSERSINTRVLITRDEVFYGITSHYQIDRVEYSI